MHWAGAASWSLSVSTGSATVRALYVRDALGLSVPHDPSSPPPLTERPAVRDDVLAPADLADAAAAWPGWWRTTLEHEARAQAEPTPQLAEADLLAWLRTRAEEHRQAVGGPPDFEALAYSPALRRAVVALFPDAERAESWRGAAEMATMRQGDGVPEVASDVGARYGVSPEQVRGAILCLPVESTWWRLIEPGAVVCSLACLTDRAEYARIVRETFESRLR